MSPRYRVHAQSLDRRSGDSPVIEAETPEAAAEAYRHSVPDPYPVIEVTQMPEEDS